MKPKPARRILLFDQSNSCILYKWPASLTHHLCQLCFWGELIVAFDADKCLANQTVQPGPSLLSDVNPPATTPAFIVSTSVELIFSWRILSPSSLEWFGWALPP